MRPDLGTEPLKSKQRPFFMVVELAGDDGHGDIYLIGNPLEVSPDARIPIGIRVVGVRNPVAVVIQPPAQDSDIRFNLGTVQIEGIVVLSDRLAGRRFRPETERPVSEPLWGRPAHLLLPLRPVSGRYHERMGH